jgi:nucleoside-triphosphatase THEP1
MSDKKILNCRNVVLITGEKNTGKTFFCIEMIKRLQNTKILVKGLISPGQYRNGKKIGIIARDIQSGKERMLATHSPGKRVVIQPENIQMGGSYIEKIFKNRNIDN